MAYAQVIHGVTPGTGGSDITTAAYNTTGTTILIVAVTDYAPTGAATVSDSKSNFWNKLTSQTDPGNIARVTIYYSINPTVGSGHTFTAGNGGTSYPSLFLQAWSGADTTSPFDVENGSQTLQTGSVTPNQNGSLIIAADNPWLAPPTSIDSGFTLDDTNVYNPSNAFAGGIAYLVQGTAGAVNPTFTAAGGGGGSVIAVFKPAAGSASVIKTFNNLANASTKTVNGVSNSSIKTFNGVSNV